MGCWYEKEEEEEEEEEEEKAPLSSLNKCPRAWQSPSIITATIFNCARRNSVRVSPEAR